MSEKNQNKSLEALSERKSAVDALRESETLFRTIIDASKDAMIAIDRQGLIILFNPAAEEMFGYYKEKMLQRPLDSLIPEEFRAIHRQYIENYFSTGNPHKAIGKTLELPALRRGGYRFSIELSLSVGKTGENEFVLAVIRDITMRKKAEEALGETKERYRSLVDNIQLGVTLIDQDYNIKMTNPEQAKMSGKTIEELLEKKCYREFEGKDSVCPHCPGFTAMLEGKPEVIETKRMNSGGEFFDVRVHAFPIFSADNKVTGFINVVEDITGRKRMESEIKELFEARIVAERKQNEAAQLAAQAAQLASIGVIAAGITHEINQPLSAIQMHANTLLYLVGEKKYLLPEPFNKIFHEISEGSHRINNIIQHMRSFWLSPNSEPIEKVDVNEAIKSALTLTNRKALSHSIRIKLDLSPQPPIVQANKLQIEQIVINLIINAIQSLDQKSSSQKEILISTSTSDKMSVLKVQDNGIGLPNVKSEDLFNPFFSTKKPGEGMGLGLAIVKMFVDRFNGLIEAETNKEGGATFVILFPVP